MMPVEHAEMRPRHGQILSLNISREKGTIKCPVPEGIVDASGIVGDAHAGPWHRQVSLLSAESLTRFAAETGRGLHPGELAENLTVAGLDLRQTALLDRFRISDVELEVTQIGKKCHGNGCAIFREVGKCILPVEGIFCRVLAGGTIRPDDAIAWLPRELAVTLITMSDRAFRSAYADRSGPRMRELLEAFFLGAQWRVRFQEKLLPDDAGALRAELLDARARGDAAVFTSGGTGVGPRDITPETAAAVCDKLLPGIMEHIRMKFGELHPTALLSRGIAGVAGETLVYTLPGSVRAVEEYLGEIVQTLDHLLYMVHGLDVH